MTPTNARPCASRHPTPSVEPSRIRVCASAIARRGSHISLRVITAATPPRVTESVPLVGVVAPLVAELVGAPASVVDGLVSCGVLVLIRASAPGRARRPRRSSSRGSLRRGARRRRRTRHARPVRAGWRRSSPHRRTAREPGRRRSRRCGRRTPWGNGLTGKIATWCGNVRETTESEQQWRWCSCGWDVWPYVAGVVGANVA